MSKKVYVALTSIAFEAGDKEDALVRATQIGQMLGHLVEHPLWVTDDGMFLDDPVLTEFKVYVSKPSEALPGRGQDKEQAIL